MPKSGAAKRMPLSEIISRWIARRTDLRITHLARHPEKIGRRLRQLEREWDVERTLEANATGLSLAGVILGLSVSRKFLYIPALIGGYLLFHSVRRKRSPVTFLRRLGMRTLEEIERERQALQALRGDFNSFRRKKIEKPYKIIRNRESSLRKSKALLKRWAHLH